MATAAIPRLPDADAEYMLQFKSGDCAAFEALVNKHRAPVTRYLYRLVRNSCISEELTQEVFLRVHRNRHSYEPTAPFASWLYRIARYLALNWIRDHRHDRMHDSIDRHSAAHRRRDLWDRTADLDRYMSSRGYERAVRRAIGRLPERQRRVVILHKYEGLGCIDIAERMCCTHQAVRSMLVRAYVTLRSQLADLEREL